MKQNSIHFLKKKNFIGIFILLISVNISFGQSKIEQLDELINLYIHSRYQNLGLSKLLYKHALQVLNKKKKINYIGMSSTKKILQLAKKLKRKPYLYFLIK